MRKFKVLITPTAKKDIEDIIQYIKNDLKNKAAADAILNKLKNSIFSLSELPFRHHLVADSTIAKMNIRKILVENYIVFYTVSEDSSCVDIIRVLYARRDWMNLI